MWKITKKWTKMMTSEEKIEKKSFLKMWYLFHFFLFDRSGLRRCFGAFLFTFCHGLLVLLLNESKILKMTEKTNQARRSIFPDFNTKSRFSFLEKMKNHQNLNLFWKNVWISSNFAHFHTFVSFFYFLYHFWYRRLFVWILGGDGSIFHLFTFCFCQPGNAN